MRDVVTVPGVKHDATANRRTQYGRTERVSVSLTGPVRADGRPLDRKSKSDESFDGVKEPYHPHAPHTLSDVGLPDTYIEALIFKHLLAVGSNSGREVARDLCLPGKPVLELLAELKGRQLVVHKGQAAMSDFVYTLTVQGRELAARYQDECAYYGAAPVPFGEYVQAVSAQSIQKEHPGIENIRHAFRDLLIRDEVLERLGPAINSGRGLFLFGCPGNGKTSIAERITGSFGGDIWIPKTLFMEGETIQLFDPNCHDRVRADNVSHVESEPHDARWIKIRRPTIICGGELTMASLELCYDRRTKITEAPLQLKANGGTLVIDDFGRQRMNPDVLLNRWIVPLEKRYDFLTLNSGSKIEAPFDELIVFSTNLEPRDLVDEAFLRRIPYKINIGDPTEDEFRTLLELMAGKLDVQYAENAVEHLIRKHYHEAGRPFRCCHPRDLMLQIVNSARFRRCHAVMNANAIDRACEAYFTLL